MLKKQEIKHSNLRDYYYNLTKNLNLPMEAMIEITTKCCLKCVHCYNQNLKSRNEMSYSQICSILDQLASIGVLFLRITGGEPLLHSKFWKIIEYARKKEFAVSLNSNGVLITSEVAKKLAANAVSFIDISIYGMDEATYQAVTGVKGVFKRVMKAIKYMKKEGLIFSLKTIAMRENFSQIKVFKEMAEKLRVKYRISCDIFSCFDGCKKPLEHKLSYCQLKELFIQNLDYFGSIGKAEISPDRLLCENNNLAINSEGQVLPCLSLFSNDKEMNVKNNSILQIYKNNPLFNLRRKIFWKSIPACMNCAALKYCFICPVDFLYGFKFSSNPPKERCKMAWLIKGSLEN